MSIEKIRAQVISSIWHALAQSGVNLSSITNDQQEQLVREIADALMVTFDSILDEEVQSQPDLEIEGDGDERLLWKGRPFLSMVESYVITSERLKLVKGFLSRDVENFELIRIQDIDFKQGVSDRILGIGDITVRGHDPSDPEIELRNVANPEEVHEILRQAWLEARKRHGLQFREFM
jgi:hypothetical protein